MQHIGGEVVAAGRDYQARFTKNSLAFTTRRGAALSFTLTQIGRRSVVRDITADAVMSEIDGHTIRYLRPGVVEIYELRDDGVKQSFVFAQLPVGTGELVVRGTVDTTLEQQHASACELAFRSHDGSDGVSIGGVTGIDARGATARGTLHYQNGALEMSLPAEFVESAVLPLTLDPLIGSNRRIGTAIRDPFGSTPWFSTGTAYDPDTDRYFTVWDSPIGFVVTGKTFQAAGTPAGEQFFLPGLPYNGSPKVAWVDAPHNWVVSMISFICVTPTTLVASVSVDGATAGGSPLPPWQNHGSNDIGGGPGGSDAILVVQNWDTTRLELVEFDVATMTTTQILGIPQTDGDDRDPAIASVGGTAGRYLVTWTRGPYGNDKDIWGTIVDRDLVELAAPFPIADSNELEWGSDVDGDGTNWVVAYTHGAGGDIHCRGVSYDAATGNVMVTSDAVVAADPAAERDPKVVCTGESYLVGFLRNFGGGDWDIWAASIESFDCLSCEGLFKVSAANVPDLGIGLASQAPWGGNEAQITWAKNNSEAPEVLGRNFRAADGTIAELGGACGGGGTASATCASVPGNFGLRTQFATQTAPGSLLLGATVINAPCGPCTLVPDPVIALPITTDGTGEAKVAITLSDPSLTGASLVVQWLVASPGGCLGTISLSNALAVTIE